MVEFQNIKTFLLKDTLHWSEKVFIAIGVKNTVLWAYAVSDLNGKEITGSFYEKELRETS